MGETRDNFKVLQKSQKSDIICIIRFIYKFCDFQPSGHTFTVSYVLIWESLVTGFSEPSRFRYKYCIHYTLQYFFPDQIYFIRGKIDYVLQFAQRLFQSFENYST